MIETLEQQVAALSEAFPKSVQKKNPKGMTYVPVSEVITRLNNVFGASNWSYEVVDVREAGTIHTQSGDYPKWISARVRIDARFVDGSTSYREGYGGQEAQFTPRDDPRGPVDLGDVYKGATSDALKKAAQGYGVALDLARTEEAMAAEADAKTPKAQPKELNAIKEYVEANAEIKDDFNGWWKENVGKKMNSGMVTVEEAQNAMEHLGIQPF